MLDQKLIEKNVMPVLVVHGRCGMIGGFVMLVVDEERVNGINFDYLYLLFSSRSCTLDSAYATSNDPFERSSFGGAPFFGRSSYSRSNCKF